MGVFPMASKKVAFQPAALEARKLRESLVRAHTPR